MVNTCLQVRANPILADPTKNLTSSSSSLTLKYAGGPLLAQKSLPEILSYRVDLGTSNSSAALLVDQKWPYRPTLSLLPTIA